MFLPTKLKEKELSLAHETLKCAVKLFPHKCQYAIKYLMIYSIPISI